MKKAFVLLAVLSFMLVISANGGVFPWDYNDYNGQEGYSSEEVVENNIVSNVSMNQIIFSGLSGSAICNGDGTMDIDLSISRVPRTAHIIVFKKVNNDDWIEINRFGATLSGNSSKKLNAELVQTYFSFNKTFTETGLVTGDVVSYKVIYYTIKQRVLAVSNIESFTYQ